MILMINLKKNEGRETKINEKIAENFGEKLI